MRLFSPNINLKGRLVRGLAGLTLLAAGLWMLDRQPWPGLLLLAGSGFVLFEALRGWCVLRACGIKTRL